MRINLGRWDQEAYFFSCTGIITQLKTIYSILPLNGSAFAPLFISSLEASGVMLVPIIPQSSPLQQTFDLRAKEERRAKEMPLATTCTASSYRGKGWEYLQSIWVSRRDGNGQPQCFANGYPAGFNNIMAGTGGRTDSGT